MANRVLSSDQRGNQPAPNRVRRRLQRISKEASPLVGLLAVLIAGAILWVEASAPAGTFALFGAGTNNGSSFAAVAVYAPPSITSVSASDASAKVTFPAAQPNNNGNGNGYAISGLNIQPPGAAPNCATQTYGAATFRGGAALANPNVTYTDALSGLAAGPVQNYAGSWSCFQVQTGYSTTAPGAWTQVPGITGAGTQGWYSVQNPRTGGARIGFFADTVNDPGNAFVPFQSASSFTTPGMMTAVNQAEDNFTWPAKGFAVTGAGTPTVTIAALGGGNTVAINTTITLHYASVPANQPAFNGSVCFANGVAAANTIYLADPLAAGNCTYDEIGILKGGTIANAGTGTRVAATYTWGVPTAQDLQVKFTAASAVTINGAGPWTDAPETATRAMPLTLGQKFIVHYAAPTNQPVETGPICYDNSVPALYFADHNNAGACGDYRLGTATAGTLTGGGTTDRFTATYTWTNSQTMTVAITNLNGHAADVLSNNWTWTSAVASTPQELFVGDVFTFKFAAAPTVPPNYNPYPLCLDGVSTIYLGDWGGVCTTGAAGTLTGGTNTSNSAADLINVTWAWAGAVLTATVTNLNGNTGDFIGGTWTFNPATVTTDEPLLVNQTFIVHYNQPTSQPVFPAGDVVCFTNNGIGGLSTVFLASPAAGCNGSTTDDVGYLVGGTTLLGFGPSDTVAATYTWTNSQTLTITITNLNANSEDMGGTWTFEPSVTGLGTLVRTASTALGVCSPAPAGQLATQSCWPTNS